MNGKGDAPRNNLSEQFRSNYDAINWSKGPKRRFRAIAAADLNGAIGLDGKLPWPSIKEDFEHFKRMTFGGNLVCGRKTFDGLPPLKNRTLFILSKSNQPMIHGVPWTGSPWWSGDGRTFGFFDNTDQIPDGAWVIGGAEIYKLLFPECYEFHLTRVKAEYQADTFLPDFTKYFKSEPEITFENDRIRIEKYTS
jgi:dihydrofolate reductase